VPFGFLAALGVAPLLLDGEDASGGSAAVPLTDATASAALGTSSAPMAFSVCVDVTPLLKAVPPLRPAASLLTRATDDVSGWVHVLLGDGLAPLALALAFPRERAHGRADDGSTADDGADASAAANLTPVVAALPFDPRDFKQLWRRCSETGRLLPYLLPEQCLQVPSVRGAPLSLELHNKAKLTSGHQRWELAGSRNGDASGLIAAGKPGTALELTAAPAGAEAVVAAGGDGCPLVLTALGSGGALQLSCLAAPASVARRGQRWHVQPPTDAAVRAVLLGHGTSPGAGPRRTVCEGGLPAALLHARAAAAAASGAGAGAAAVAGDEDDAPLGEVVLLRRGAAAAAWSLTLNDSRCLTLRLQTNDEEEPDKALVVSAPLPALETAHVLVDLRPAPLLAIQGQDTNGSSSNNNSSGDHDRNQSNWVGGAANSTWARVFVNGSLAAHALLPPGVVLQPTTDPLFLGPSPWSEGESGGGGGSNQSGPIGWHPEHHYERNGNIEFSADGAVATFNSNSQHRCVYGSIGFNRGVHEWTITVLNRPCCAYVGIARNIEDPNNRGPQDKFHDAVTSHGVSDAVLGSTF
jgi:hypothetical protein